MLIPLSPSSFRSFGPPEGASFCLVTNSSISSDFKLEDVGDYQGTRIFHYDTFGTLDRLFEDEIPDHAHVLLISPHCFVESPRPEILGPHRKLLALPCGSTPTNVEAIAHFLRALEAVDPEQQQQRADRFFELAEGSDHLRIVNSTVGTEARFGHLTHDYEWNEQVGIVDWGEQQIVPSGEISALPADIMSYSKDLRVDLNGTIAFKGPSIVHSGTASFSPADQQRIHSAFATAGEHAVIATVEDGVLTAFEETDERARPARKMFESLCQVDSRYRIVWEMGFGINSDFVPLDGNCGMNEPYGGASGIFHLGIGLTPHTQYAPIFLCEGSQVLASSGEIMIGGERCRRLKVNRGAGCGCH